MKIPFHKAFKRLLITASAAAALLCLLLLVKHLPQSESQKQDYQQLASTEYDTVFFSMYPIDSFREEDFSYYRGMTLCKSTYCIPSLSVLKDYLRQAARSGNQITTAYLGIRPELAEPRKLQKLLARYPDIHFEILLPCSSAEYWKSLSQKDYERTLSAFCSLLATAAEIPNANFYFYDAEEWLISNPGNYLDDGSVNEDIAGMLVTHSDSDHGYLVTAENAESDAWNLTSLTGALRAASLSYPDLDGSRIVFFGDSVIGNSTDSTSIPGVVAGLTGAEIYNCGYGGNSAAMAPDIPISLPGIVDAFFREDLSVLPRDTQVYAGISDYLENASSDKPLCFVIYYGLNDYFSGYPISSEDPYDITTYSGAVRTAVRLIRANAPDAQIILCAPNFSAIFENGTEPHGVDGSVLTDYVDALLALSEELQTDALDTYHDLGITPENQGEYLADQVHPNNICRFRIGSALSRLVKAP